MSCVRPSNRSSGPAHSNKIRRRIDLLIRGERDIILLSLFHVVTEFVAPISIDWVQEAAAPMSVGVVVLLGTLGTGGGAIEFDDDDDACDARAAGTCAAVGGC